MPRCCSRRWASSPSCSSVAATCAGARRTPGVCGARKILTPESNVQFGEGGAGLFSDGKLYSQIKDPKFYGRKVMHEFVRAGAPAEILYVSKPHIGTFRLTGIVEKMRAEIIELGGEVRFESKVTDVIDRERPDRRRRARERRTPEQPARGARARPQLARHAAHARAARRLPRGKTLCDRLSDRTSPVAHRPRAVRPLRRSPRARGGGLQDRASREQRPLGLQLLHVPGWHGRGGDLRAWARGDQRHEPVLAQRTQRERRHRRRHQSRAGFSGWPARGGRPAGSARVEGIRARRPRLLRAGSTRRRFRARHCLEAVRRGAAVVPARRVARRSRLVAAGLCHRRHSRSAAGVRQADPGLRPRRRGAHRRGKPHVVARAHHARRGIVAESQCPWPLSLRRRRGLRRRHPVRGRRWNQGGRGGRAGSHMKFEDIKRLHEKKFREKLKHFIIEGEHLVQELEKAAARDARLRESKIFVTRDYANWPSKLPMHVIQSKHMAQISETRSPQGIAAVVPLLEPAAPRAGRTRGLSARDPGSRKFRHHPAHAGVVRKLPLPLQSRQRGPAQRQGGARQHGRHLPRSGRVRCADGRFAKTFRAHRLAGSRRAAGCLAGISGIRLLCVRQRSARTAARTDERPRREGVHDRGNRRHRIAERGGDREHLPVRAQPRLASGRAAALARAGTSVGANPPEPRPQIGHFRFAQRVRHRIGMPFHRVSGGGEQVRESSPSG